MTKKKEKCFKLQEKIIMGIIIKDFNLEKYLQIDKSWTWKEKMEKGRKSSSVGRIRKKTERGKKKEVRKVGK